MPAPGSCQICDGDPVRVLDISVDLCPPNRRSIRDVAGRYGVSKSTVQRHMGCISKLLGKAFQVRDIALEDELVGRVESLQARTLAILEAAEETEELRTALSAVREARENLLALAKLRQLVDDSHTVNLLIHPQWIALRTTIIGSLRDHPEARESVLTAIETAGSGAGWDGS